MKSTMAGTTPSASDWWRARRRRYNLGLVVAGVLAFIVYVVIGSVLLPADANFEITLFTTLLQGVGYLVMMGVANICYFLGPLLERVVLPSDPERYRRICYRLGFWFSLLLPFSIPALLVVEAVFRPAF